MTLANGEIKLGIFITYELQHVVVLTAPLLPISFANHINGEPDERYL